MNCEMKEEDVTLDDWRLAVESPEGGYTAHKAGQPMRTLSIDSSSSDSTSDSTSVSTSTNTGTSTACDLYDSKVSS